MHALFCGVTMSGKTSLAKAIARALPSQDRVYVYDPVSLPEELEEWDATFVTDDFQTFMEYVRDPRNAGAHLFIDEAGEHFSVGQRENHWLLTRGRHMGYKVNLIAQRPKLLAPTVRTQCGRVYMFRLASDDAEEIGKDFGHAGLARETLDKGECLIVDSAMPHYKRVNAFALIDKGASAVRNTTSED